MERGGFKIVGNEGRETVVESAKRKCLFLRKVNKRSGSEKGTKYSFLLNGGTEFGKLESKVELFELENRCRQVILST
jgi:hypothetical protein